MSEKPSMDHVDHGAGACCGQCGGAAPKPRLQPRVAGDGEGVGVGHGLRGALAGAAAKAGVEAAKARRCVSRWARIARSCYSTDDIDAALADDDVHYLSVGPVFGTLPWAGRLPGLDLVRHAARVAPQATPGAKPWFAIGGITGANLDEVLDAGARRIAVGRAITAAADPASAARMFDHRLRASWRDEFDDYTLDALRD